MEPLLTLLPNYLYLVGALVLGVALLTATAIQVRSGIIGMGTLLVTAVVFPIEADDPVRSPWNSSLPVAAFIVGAWLLGSLASRHQSDLKNCRIVMAVAALVASVIASFLLAQFSSDMMPHAPLESQIAGLGMFVISGGLLLAVAHQIYDMKSLSRLVWMFVITGTVVCITQTFQGFGLLGRWTTPDSIGALFWTWLVTICASQAVFNSELSATKRVILLAITTLTLVRGLWVAGSWASGWLPPLAALCVVFLFRSPRLFIGLALLAIPAVLSFRGRLIELLIVNEHYSTLTRLEAWKTLWPIIKGSPLIGSGPANYYYFVQQVPILGWYVRFSSHNQYADLLAQTGFIGLASFVWVLFEIGHSALQLYSHAHGAFAKSYAVGALAGLAATVVAGMLADWVIPFYYNIGIRGFRSSFLFWFFSGGVLALKRLNRRATESVAAPVTCVPVCDAVPIG